MAQITPSVTPVVDSEPVSHPHGLSTLFFTEMWERFSYYGMRALLVLFMTAPLFGVHHGLGFSVEKSTAIYGLYTSLVYLTALPGGWIADKLWGQRKAVFWGGAIIACGHFSLAIPSLPTFYFGLFLIVIGTGLLKPNVSVMVGELYPEGGARRDAGFSIFYMGINLGAFLGTILCGLISEDYNFHWGFSLAGIGMVLGLIQYSLGGKRLGTVGKLKSGDEPAVLARRSRNFYLVSAATAAVLAVLVYLAFVGVLNIEVQELAHWLGYSILILSGVFFLYLFFSPHLTGLEKKRVGVVVWLFLLSAVFWSGFEQAGSSMNLFARDLTDRSIGGWLMPASWLQNVNSIFIILLAPVFGWVWTSLAARRANPATPVKFALGLFGLAGGFFVLSWGAANATDVNRVSMVWLVVTYFFHTVGELCLSPVGLSATTKLAPRGRTGEMMGLWFISIALGDLIAGLVAGHMQELSPSALFHSVATFIGATGVVALAMSPVVKRFSGNVD